MVDVERIAGREITAWIVAKYAEGEFDFSSIARSAARTNDERGWRVDISLPQRDDPSGNGWTRRYIHLDSRRLALAITRAKKQCALAIP
jgi:hypothetical protein